MERLAIGTRNCAWHRSYSSETYFGWAGDERRSFAIPNASNTLIDAGIHPVLRCCPGGRPATYACSVRPVPSGGSKPNGGQRVSESAAQWRLRAGRATNLVVLASQGYLLSSPDSVYLLLSRVELRSLPSSPDVFGVFVAVALAAARPRRLSRQPDAAPARLPAGVRGVFSAFSFRASAVVSLCFPG
jgi:hypothetical protein